MTDVLLRQTNDDGDITITAGLCQMSEGLETAVYLSLFGGNETDEGGADTTLQWWGNLAEVDPARIYRSETQALLKSLPLIPANLRRVEQAADRDLAWMLAAGVAQSITIAASIPALNRMQLAITVVTLLEQVTFTFG